MKRAKSASRKKKETPAFVLKNKPLQAEIEIYLPRGWKNLPFELHPGKAKPAKTGRSRGKKRKR
ncbi:MAG: hypothetical protein ACRD50_00755 [Candidatus Acidiferrales bacterium]